MPSERNFLASFVLGIGAVLLAIYALIPFLVKKAPLEAALRDSLGKSGVSIEYKKLGLAAFPSLSVILEDADLAYRENKLKAKKIKVGLRFPQYWQGRVVPSSIQVQNGNFDGIFTEGPLKNVSLENISASVKNIGQGQAIRFDFKSDLEETAKAVSFKGMLRIPQFKNLDPKTFFLDVRGELKQTPLEKLADKWRFRDSVSLESGNVTLNFHVRKKTGDGSVFFAGGLDVQKLVYALGPGSRDFSLPMDASAVYDFIWDMESGNLNFQKNSFSFPFGKADLRGDYQIKKNSFKGMHVSLSQFSLDLLPQYYMPLREGIPFSLGFSGESQVEISLDGQRDNLVIHGEWSMTPMLLTYAKYFSKPKNFPANLSLDFILKNGQDLSGDFSFFLGEAVFKGAFSKLDLASGEGEMNIISNKFSISGWEQMMLPLQDYKLGGSMKILANLNGNILRKPETLKSMINLTLDGASISDSRGQGLQNLSLSLDFAPVSFELRQSRFEIGRSSFIVSGKALHPLHEPEVSLKINAPVVYVPECLEVIDSLAGKIFSGNLRARFDYAKSSAGQILGQAEPVKNLAADLSYKPGVWTVKDFQAQVLGGALKSSGDYTLVSQTYRVNSQLDRLDISQMGAQKALDRPLVEGNLFATLEGFGQVSDSEWQRKFSGEGFLSVTAGSFSSLDLLAGLGKISELSSVQKFSNGQTRFDDLRSDFKISDGKVLTPKVDIIGSEVSAKGNGDISLVDGNLNYGLDVFLSKTLSQEILEEIGVPDGTGLNQLGPVPFLVAGNFGDLQLKPEPERLSEFQENFSKKKAYKVFNNFLPEDFLSNRPTSS